MSDDIDIGQISEALNDKVDRDCRNVDIGVGADVVIEYQNPTAGTNNKWYRKYASGWIEQGGVNLKDSISGNVMSITLPIEMANPDYTSNMTVCLTKSDSGSYYARVLSDKTTTELKYFIFLNNSVTTNTPYVCWEVKGMAAS